MHKRFAGLLLGLLGALAMLPALADTNVALGGAVSLNGVFGVLGPSGLANWGSGSLAPASSLTDGVFLPEQTQWNLGSVFWDASVAGAANNTIDINLGGTYAVSGLTVQADDNDSYQVQYWSGSSWQDLWNVPAVSSWGLVTRTSGSFAPVTTDALRVYASSGDGYYAISEVQAFGSAVPEPETYALLALGAVAVMVRRRRQR